MTTRAQLADALLEFPARDRAEAARTLLRRDDEDDDPVCVDTEWRDEIARRVLEIENGEVTTEDGPTAMSRLRSQPRDRLERRRS